MSTSIITAKVSIVKIGDSYGFDGLQLEDEQLKREKRNYGISIQQTASLFQLPPNNAQRDIKRILGKDFSFLSVHTDREEIECKRVRSVEKALLTEDLRRLLLPLRDKGNVVAKELAEILIGVAIDNFFKDAFGVPVTPEDRQEIANRVTDNYRKTHPLFGNENHKKLAELLHCSRGCAKMANFYLDYVYFDFTPSEKRKLDEKNPVINGARRQTIYSWIEENMMDTYKERFDTLLTLLKVSETEQEFKNLWHRTFERKPKLFMGLWG